MDLAQDKNSSTKPQKKQLKRVRRNHFPEIYYNILGSLQTASTLDPAVPSFYGTNSLQAALDKAPTLYRNRPRQILAAARRLRRRLALRPTAGPHRLCAPGRWRIRPRPALARPRRHAHHHPHRPHRTPRRPPIVCRPNRRARPPDQRWRGQYRPR